MSAPPMQSAPPSHPAPPGERVTRSQRRAATRARPGQTGARRTMLTLLATALGAVPLKALLSDDGWLLEAWLTMLVVIAPAALLRLRRPPGALDIWPGVVLLVPWLTLLFLHQHAWGGIIPNAQTGHDLSHLMNSLHRTTRDDVAPIHSTPAVRLVVCALLGLLAALTDLIAVVGRRGALAGVPLLVVYTVSGAVPRSPVAWFWFAIAAVGYLILLGLDAEDELHAWGRRISRPGTSRRHPALAFSAQRIGVLAIAAAVILPFLVPDHPKNLLSEAFHNSSTGIGGFGAGGDGDGGTISPFASLKGQLTRSTPKNLMTVHVDSGGGAVPPYYARVNVLTDVTEQDWTLASHGATQPLQTTNFDTVPPNASVTTREYRVSIKVSGLRDAPPVFSVPTEVGGVRAKTTWNPQDQLLQGPSVQDGDTITETFEQPWPSRSELENATGAIPSSVKGLLQLPPEPPQVYALVAELTKGLDTPYAKALAISNYFANPSNGFAYSLIASGGDSGSELLDFLNGKQGYCQQYAAAMGIMLRMAGVPSRVVLGYMHPAADQSGNFTITTSDAHAWVEAYFSGLGWIPFDPTPGVGVAISKSSTLPWGQSNFSTNPNDAPPSRHNSASVAPNPTHGLGNTTPPATAAPAQDSESSLALLSALGLLVVLVLLALLPAGVRTSRRRRRLGAARRGDPDPLWAELSDTAVDLGYVWSPARTPRQVAAWLGRDAGGTRAALEALAAAVEQRRYAPDPARRDTGELARGLQEVTEQLRAQRTGRIRLQSRFWPASLGWGRRLRGLRAVLPHRH